MRSYGTGVEIPSCAKYSLKYCLCSVTGNICIMEILEIIFILLFMKVYIEKSGKFGFPLEILQQLSFFVQ